LYESKAEGKKAALFLLVPELACSPQNEALISAYLDLGYEIELFTLGGSCEIGAIKSHVGRQNMDVDGYFEMPCCRFWRRYSLFSGTSENPLAIVGILSTIHRRPAIAALVDEITSGSYRGNARES
jgi:hypothetical protein